MLERMVTGLDVGSWSVKAAELKVGLRSVELVRLEQMRLSASDDLEARSAALAEFFATRELPRELIVTALPGDAVTQRPLRFPFRTGRKIEQAIHFEIEEELPLPIEEMLLAHEEISTHPAQTHVLAVLAPRGRVAAHLDSLQQAELEPRIIEVEGLVLGNLSGLLQFSHAGRVLLDIGHRKTTLCLMVDGKPLALRTIPIAGQHFTAALAQDHGLDLAAAEERKHEQGLFEPMSTVPASPGLEGLLDRLARETLRSIQAVTSNPLDPVAPEALVLCGGSAATPRLAEYLGQQTGLPCRVLSVPAGAEGCEELRGDPATFAHAAALAMRGAGRHRVTRVDLRQQEFRYVADLSGLRGQLRVTMALFGVVLALWVASIGTQLWSLGSREDALRAELARVYEETIPGGPAVSEPVRVLEADLRAARELANHLGVIGGGVSVLEVLRHISERIPQSLDISLSDLRLERHSVRARGYTRDFVSVDRVRAELEKVDVFEKVVLSDVVTDTRSGGKSFALTIQFAGSGT